MLLLLKRGLLLFFSIFPELSLENWCEKLWRGLDIVRVKVHKVMKTIFYIKSSSTLVKKRFFNKGVKKTSLAAVGYFDLEFIYHP